MQKDVMMVVGAGQISMAIARRCGFGKKIVLGDRNLAHCEKIGRIMSDAGFDVETVYVDLASRDAILEMIQKARVYGEIKYLVNGAGVSPSQASIEDILRVDLYGTAVLLEEVGKRIACGGAGVTISSQSGFRMPQLTPQEDRLLAMTPTESFIPGLAIIIVSVILKSATRRRLPWKSSSRRGRIALRLCRKKLILLFIRHARKSLANARPKIATTVEHFEQYDTVYLGYPIWWGDMPMVVYTFIESYDFDNKTVISFNTHEGSGQAGTCGNLRKALPKATVKDGLVMTGSTAQNDPDEVERQVKALLQKD